MKRWYALVFILAWCVTWDLLCPATAKLVRDMPWRQWMAIWMFWAGVFNAPDIIKAGKWLLDAIAEKANREP